MSGLAPAANGPGTTRATSIVENAAVVPPPTAPPMRTGPSSVPPLMWPSSVRRCPPSALSVSPGSAPRRVKICTTPPIAAEPYRLDRLPRTISMRSIASSAMPPTAAAPLVPALSRTPSTSTSTCEEFAPRTNSDAAVPRPPDCANCTPVSRDEQADDVDALRALDVRAGDDRCRRQRVIDRLGLPRRRDHRRRQLRSRLRQRRIDRQDEKRDRGVLPRAGEAKVDIVTPARRPAAGKVHTRTGRESAGQGAGRAWPAGTPRLVLLPMAGLRAAGMLRAFPRRCRKWQVHEHIGWQHAVKPLVTAKSQHNLDTTWRILRILRVALFSDLLHALSWKTFKL